MHLEGAPNHSIKEKRGEELSEGGEGRRFRQKISTSHRASEKPS